MTSSAKRWHGRASTIRHVHVSRWLLDRVDSETKWFVDRHAEPVGHGVEDFERACDALQAWAQFDQSWTRPALPPAPLLVGENVGYTARMLGVWWSYCCRIVSVVDRHDADTGDRAFGLVYGTVGTHAERGEEQFLVEYHAKSGDVTYSLFAMSRPGAWFTVIGLPFSRLAQAKFRAGSAKAVREFVATRRQAPVGAA